jgi:hypothetical protein
MRIEWNADEMRFQGGICDCKASLLLPIHVRLRSYQGLNNLQMTCEACTVQRNGSSSVEKNGYWLYYIGQIQRMHADTLRLKGGRCSCKILRVLRVHAVAASRHEVLDKSQVTHASRLVDTWILHSDREDS